MKLAIVALPVVVLIYYLHAESTVHAVNPGFRAIITPKALDFASQKGLTILTEYLKNITVPSYTGSYDYKGIIKVEYTISNGRVNTLNFGDATLIANDVMGVVFTSKAISMSLSADWSIEAEELKDHGTVDISTSTIALNLSIDIKENKTSGGFLMNTTGCYIHVSDLDVNIHGGDISVIINLFKQQLENELRSYLNDDMCSKVVCLINEEGNEKAGSFPVVCPIEGSNVQINYALVNNPDFNHTGYIITNHKGVFELISNPQDPPFPPPSLPNPSGNYSRMIYIYASTYVAESASYAFWKAGRMAYNVTNSKLPSGLGTTTIYCGIISQELCKKYPGKKVKFGVEAIDYPRVKIAEKYALVTAKADVSMYVDNDGIEETAFTLELDIETDAKAMLRCSGGGQCFIGGNVSNPRVNVTLAKSNIGNFNMTTISRMITTLIDTFGLVYINNYIMNGFPIPTIDGFGLTNPSLKFGNGFVEVSGDIEYNPHGHSVKLNCTSKRHL